MTTACGEALGVLDRALSETGKATATALGARVEEPSVPTSDRARILRWSNAGHPLSPGATVLLYTDGLVEHRNATLDDGFDMDPGIQLLRGIPEPRQVFAVVAA